MTSQLQHAIQVVQVLTSEDQLELLKTLSGIVQQTQPEEGEIEEDTGFSAERFQAAWQQAITGKTLPLSELWEGIDVE
jgi:hypothetical protein